ncbi:MAG: Hsp20 family protein [Alphaproteobacteria bacterium]
MSRLSLLNSPLLLGFDQFERTLERVAKASAEGYPPYNIERIGEDRLRITLAVAGFSMAELEVFLEDNQLTVRGRQQDPADRVYLHRGIAARQFQRSFMLADGIEIVGAVLDKGLLNIDFTRPIPQRNIRNIEITTASEDDALTIDVALKSDQAALSRHAPGTAQEEPNQ